MSRYGRRSSGGGGRAAFVILFPFVAAFLVAWPLMIVLGIVHAHVLSLVVPVGFGVSYSLVIFPLVVTWTLTMIRLALFGD